MLIKTFASAVYGISATTIRIEVHVFDGIGYSLVGLPDNAVKESQQRIISSFTEIGMKWPGSRCSRWPRYLWCFNIEGSG